MPETQIFVDLISERILYDALELGWGERILRLLSELKFTVGTITKMITFRSLLPHKPS